MAVLDLFWNSHLIGVAGTRPIGCNETENESLIKNVKGLVKMLEYFLENFCNRVSFAGVQTAAFTALPVFKILENSWDND